MVGQRRVVVTGLGVATPIGIGIDPFWESLLERRCGLSRTKAFDPSGLAVQISGELPEFKFSDYIPKSYRKSMKVMSRDILVAVVAAYHAVKDAGLNTKCIIDRGEAEGSPNVDSTRFGANIGAGLICADLTELAVALSTAAGPDGSFDIEQWGREGMTNLTPLWLLKFLPNMLACHVTIVHDARAPSNTLTCGEASSHLAIGEAFRTIQRGDADVCICGGAESKTNPMAMTRPLICGRLNIDANDRPQHACRPFAADRCGTVVSEGGGLVILEDLDHAVGRGARIYAELSGFGASSNAESWDKPDASGEVTAMALRNAFRDAGKRAADVDLVVPFGTGIEDCDSAEIAGWNKAMGDQLDRCWALTTRGSVGNNGAGSGALDFAAAVMALHRNIVPPSLNTQPADEKSRFRFRADDSVDAPLTHAMTTGVALTGGQCAALLLEKYRPDEKGA